MCNKFNHFYYCSSQSGIGKGSFDIIERDGFMALAPQELENSASKFAEEAIRLDSQGSRGMAIQHYQGAVESLLKLVRL